MPSHILNLQDSVLGSMHQVTVEMGVRPQVSIDGSRLPYDHEFRDQVLSMLESWNDHFAGLELPKDEYVASL